MTTTSAAPARPNAGPAHPDLPWALFEQTFREVCESVIVADPDLRMVLANPATTHIFGFEPEQLVGRPLRMLLADPHGLDEQAQMPAVLRYRRADGQLFDGETIGNPVHNEHGQVCGHLTIIRDVSARLSAETVLSRLHDITFDPSLTLGRRLRGILELGADHFGLPIAILSRIDGEAYTITEAVTPGDALARGQTFQLGSTFCVHTLRADGPVGFHHAGDSRVCNHPAYQAFKLEAYLGAPIRLGGEHYGTLNFSSPAPTRPFTSQDLEIVQLMAQYAGHEIGRHRDRCALEAARAELERLGTVDPLTGLLNRREGARRIQEECARAARYGAPLTALLIDLDHCRSLNDTHGYNGGDRALQHFSRVARRGIRTCDHLARWEGERLLVVMPSTDVTGARHVAERLLTTLRRSPFEHEGRRVTLTASAGAGRWTPGMSSGDLLAEAERHLYEAKTAGRDTVRPTLS